MPITQSLCYQCGEPTFSATAVCARCQRSRPNIALVGRMASGKTTLATLLELRYEYKRISHADGIKMLANFAYGPLDKAQQYAVTDKKGDSQLLSGRQILQQIGQTVKQVDRDFWVRTTLRRAAETEGPTVNDDTRFTFEADALREAGFVIVRVDTPDEVRFQRYETIYGRRPTDHELNHESEREIDEIEAELTISGTIEPWEATKQLMDAMRQRAA